MPSELAATCLLQRSDLSAKAGSGTMCKSFKSKCEIINRDTIGFRGVARKAGRTTWGLRKEVAETSTKSHTAMILLGFVGLARYKQRTRNEDKATYPANTKTRSLV